MLTIELEPDTLREFNKALEDYSSVSSAEDSFIVEKQMNKTMHNARKLYVEDKATAAQINRQTKNHVMLWQNLGRGRRKLVFAPKKSAARVEILKKRKAAKGYLAATFLFPQWRPTRNNTPKRGTRLIKPKVKTRSILMQITADPYTPAAEWDSKIPGVVEMGKKKNYFNRAIRGTIADMLPYIERKRQQEFRKLFK